MGFGNVNKNNKIRNAINSIKENTEKLRRSPAVKVTDRTPIYCTFYNINSDESTASIGTEDITEYIGDQSPLKFNKINECLMYGLDEWSKDEEDDEYEGFTIDHENTSVIPVGTFKPIEDSFFKIELDNETILYRVTKVERTKIEQLSSYQIEYEAMYSDEDIEYREIEEQIVRSYTMLHENIGTEYKAIIQDDEILYMEQLSELIYNLNNLLLTQYYDSKTNTINVVEDGTLYYSPYLTEFLISTSTIRNDDDRKILVNHEMKPSDNFDFLFQQSLYIKVLKKEELTENDMIFVLEPLGIGGIGLNYSSLRIYRDKKLVSLTHDPDMIDASKTNDYIQTVTLTIPDITSTNKVDQFLHKYLNGDVDHNLIKLREVFNNKSIDYMIKLPLVLFILRHHYNNKLGKNLIGYNEMFSKKIIY